MSRGVTVGNSKEMLTGVVRDEAWYSDLSNEVLFEIPYGDKRFRIGFDQPDLSMIARNALRDIINRQPLAKIADNYQVELPQPELPLIIYPKSVEVEPSYSDRHDIFLKLGVYTLSTVHDHRGILYVQNRYLDESWRPISYEHAPELNEPLEID